MDDDGYRQILAQKMDRILAEHWRWVVSDGKEGGQGDLRKWYLQGARLKDSWNRLCQTGKVTSEQLDHLKAQTKPQDTDRVFDYRDSMGLYFWEDVYLKGLLLKGGALSEVHLEGADLRGAHLEGAELSGAHLERAYLFEAHLEGAELSGAHLERAYLRGAHLDGARLFEAHLEGAYSRGVHLEGADLRGTHLERADLFEAHFERAYLFEAHLEGARLSEAHFEGARLFEAHLEGAELRGTHLEGADLRGANLQDACVVGVYYNRKTKCKGIRVDSCYGSPMFKRFAQDQDFLEELQERSWWGKPLYQFWLVAADCGRTPWRWMFWSFLFIVFFAYLFTPLPDLITNLMPDQLNFLIDLRPRLEHTSPAYLCKPIGFYSALYFSTVTFTTLGFGDIVAANATARFLVTAEVIVGYIMLGGLISIMATLVARRSS